MTDLELMKQQLEETLKQVNDALGAYNPPPFEIKTITAEEGKLYRRLTDGMIFGKQIILGYDYSLGFKRIDKEVFYEQIPNPDLEVISENEE
ncbi:MAG: hypothetical protein PHF05_00280 [Candidatus Izemoplasmatales bacterium]|nr:hypothetical protein [Candidatus Izemoplasmatales bacterium]